MIKLARLPGAQCQYLVREAFGGDTVRSHTPIVRSR